MVNRIANAKLRNFSWPCQLQDSLPYDSASIAIYGDEPIDLMNNESAVSIWLSTDHYSTDPLVFFERV